MLFYVLVQIIMKRTYQKTVLPRLAGARALVRALKQLDTALLLACEGGHVNVARELLERGADPDAVTNIYGQFCLYFTALSGDEEMARCLLEGKATVDRRYTENRQNQTSLMKASEEGSTGVVSALLGAKADPNAVDADGFSSLYRVWKTGAVVDLLLDAGASTVIEDEDGETAFTLAQDMLGEEDPIAKRVAAAAAAETTAPVPTKK